MKPQRLATATAATSLTDLYTVPTGNRAEVVGITFCNTSTSANRTVTLKVAGCPIFSGALIPISTTVHWEGWMVLHAGEKIQAQADAAGAVAIYISGGQGSDT
ncbi:MAG TPA: hypothetical protein VF705_01740 [Longimicrobium sp.]